MLSLNLKDRINVQIVQQIITTMGVSDVLPRILESSGRPIDLRDYKNGIPCCHNKNKRNKSSKTTTSSSSSLRPLRIGVDVHSWIYTAGYAFSDMLGDERHLTYYGRASLVQEQQGQGANILNNNNDPPEHKVKEYIIACTNSIMKRLQTIQETTGAQILVVLDGRSPPIKSKETSRRRQLAQEHNQVRNDPTVIVMGSPSTIQAANNRRTKANKRAGPGRYVTQILESLVEALTAVSTTATTGDDDSTAISFMVAPYEADAQLAYLARQHYIDLIITEDSDLIAHGAPAVLYKTNKQIPSEIPAGILWQYNDIGASPLGTSKANTSTVIDLMDFTPVMLAVMFVLLGSDYTGGEMKKLKGIGLVKAQTIVQDAFFSNNHEEDSSVLSHVLNEAYKHCHDSEWLTAEFKEQYEQSFLEALFAYRHPVVFDPVMQKCLHMNQRTEEEDNDDDDGENKTCNPYENLGDPELMDHESYEELCNDYIRTAGVVGELPPNEDAVGIAEGRISWRNKKPTPPGALAASLGLVSNIASDQQKKQHFKKRRIPSRKSKDGEDSLAAGPSLRTATCAGEETSEYRSDLSNVEQQRDNMRSHGVSAFGRRHRKHGNDNQIEPYRRVRRRRSFSSPHNGSSTESSSRRDTFLNRKNNLALNDYDKEELQSKIRSVGLEDSDDDIQCSTSGGKERTEQQQVRRSSSEKKCEDISPRNDVLLEEVGSNDGEEENQEIVPDGQAVTVTEAILAPNAVLARRLFHTNGSPDGARSEEEDISTPLGLQSQPLTQEWETVQTSSSTKKRRGKRDR